MGYYIRVFGIQDPDISINDLHEALEKAGLNASLQLDPDETARTTINVENDHGQPLAQIERNPVVEGELGRKNWMNSGNLSGRNDRNRLSNG